MTNVSPYSKELHQAIQSYEELKTSQSKNAAPQNKDSFTEGFKVGIGGLPLQKEKTIAKQGASFNLLLVGQSGLGKTTFVNTLFGTSLLPNIWHNVEEVKPNVKFDKTTRITAHKVHLTENGFDLDFTVVDTPGFCDFIDNQFAYLPITEYIDEQLRLYMFQEEQPDRKKLVDNRVHACLYFINPTSKGLSPVDVEALKNISNRVNLIPVIAKSDTLTANELNEVKVLVKQIIDGQNIKICEFIEDQDVKDNILKDIPYALIGSESQVLKGNGNYSVRGRKYSWGIAEVENPQHCDFIKLRDVLMSNNMIDLISTTEKYYESCRVKLITTRFKKAKEQDDQNLSPEYADSNLDFDDPDKNGVDNVLKVLSKFNKPRVDDLVIEWSPLFIQKQFVQKKRLHEVVAFEEKKFKDWKRALFSKQTSFNDEIEQLHDQIKSIQATISKLKSHSHTPPQHSDESDEKIDVPSLEEDHLPIHEEIESAC
ncbi:hypothetical protein WICPIJ_008520 [Wickerhamomyces pijperi]|uniref:Septin-type G domain-containing protein n=1 Tax=Wickerhamomyces pijperi TaxID=599730 RepID=A0A9P8TI80_WICPI|nr:hypothetical protein WICPIJ_008520 [Wickerhamomyces pijperi]